MSLARRAEPFSDPEWLFEVKHDGFRSLAFVENGMGSATLTISPDGTFSGTEYGCSFSGTMTPDSSKNFFNLKVSYGSDPCLSTMAGKNGSGVAIETLSSDGITRQLLAGASVGGWRCAINAQRQ